MKDRRCRNLTSFVAACASVALAGCAAVPHIAATQHVRDPGSYAAKQSFTAPASHWPADGWWRSYGDPQLDALIDEGLREAPTLAAAQARIAKAQALAQASDAALWPSVSANGDVQKYRQSYNNGLPPALVPHGYNNTAQATLNLSYEFDFFGRHRAALAAAISEAEAARADADAAALSLSTSIASAYGDLAKLYADRDAAEKALAIRQHSADLTHQLVVEGLQNQGAADETDANVADAQGELMALDESIGLSRNRIAALLGEGPDRGLRIGRPDIRAIATFGLPADLQVNLIGRRPDIIAARQRAEAAAQNVKESHAAFYPDINLSAYIGHESLGLNLLTRAGSQIGAIGPAISLPIFDAGKLRANYHGSIADYDSAVADYNGTVTQALHDVADAAVSLRMLTGRLAESQKAADASQSSYDIALRCYQGGIATYLEALTAENTLITSQRNLADLHARAFSLDVSLVGALGGGFKAD
jgi:NodT family efflux transporter outer membrane factor (OMF) lipoprotein